MSIRSHSIRRIIAIAGASLAFVLPNAAHADQTFSDGTVAHAEWGCTPGAVSSSVRFSNTYGPYWYAKFVGIWNGAGWSSYTSSPWTLTQGADFDPGHDVSIRGWVAVYYWYGKYTARGWEQLGEWIPVGNVFADGSTASYSGWCYIS